jgi:hypothetical protein
MEFDLQELYQSLPNIELLKIIGRPQDYQPEAVAKQKILDQSTITDEERNIVAGHYEEEARKVTLKQQKEDSYKAAATDLLEPILQPTEHTPVSKWVNYFLLVVTADYTWSLYKYFFRLFEHFEYYKQNFGIGDLLQALWIVYTPIVLLLVLKRRRWGWIFLFADNIVTPILILSQIRLFFNHYNSVGKYLHPETYTSVFILSLIFPLIYKCGFAYFLSKEKIRTYFGIASRTKKRVVIVSVSIGIIITFLLPILYALPPKR